MKFFPGMIFLVYFATFCYHQGYSKPIDDTAYIIESQHEQLENGYRFSYKLSDGQSRQETGFLRNVDGKDVIIVQGSYSFVGDNGERITVYYVADENGYRVLDRPSSSSTSYSPRPTFHYTLPPVLKLSPNKLKSLIGG